MVSILWFGSSREARGTVPSPPNRVPSPTGIPSLFASIELFDAEIHCILCKFLSEKFQESGTLSVLIELPNCDKPSPIKSQLVDRRIAFAS